MEEKKAEFISPSKKHNNNLNDRFNILEIKQHNIINENANNYKKMINLNNGNNEDVNYDDDDTRISTVCSCNQNKIKNNIHIHNNNNKNNINNNIVVNNLNDDDNNFTTKTTTENIICTCRNLINKPKILASDDDGDDDLLTSLPSSLPDDNNVTIITDKTIFLSQSNSTILLENDENSSSIDNSTASTIETTIDTTTIDATSTTIITDNNSDGGGIKCFSAQIEQQRSNNNCSNQLVLPQNNTQQSIPIVVKLKPKNQLYGFLNRIFLHCKNSGIGEPSVYHALIVIFLEFFAWGLLTMPVISVLNQTFPDHTFLMNGLVMGIKGILSFLSAPLIGALSDVWGRKFFLLVTVFFTCAPIPLMTINTGWFFAMISISGVFAVTFSVVFAYVADVTTIEDRSKAYGLVSATFAASLVISPALGAYLMEIYSDTLVVALATAIAVLDVFFILVAVPESLPEKVRPSSWGAPISWEQADPFAALRKVGMDHTIMMQCVTVLLSYLPEAGQYSCIFVYLKLKMGFDSIEVSIFIAVVGILSILIQLFLGVLMKVLGAKRTIIIGLIFEMMQLLWYGFGSQTWMMWAAGILASLGSITYPAISAFVSIHSNADTQGVVQGMVTGMRGLCNGLGPAMFGVIFYLFHVDLNDEHSLRHSIDPKPIHNITLNPDSYAQLAPGPPFVFGAFMVICAILVAVFIPEGPTELAIRRSSNDKKRISVDVHYEIERGRKVASPLSPLMRSDSSAQL